MLQIPKLKSTTAPQEQLFVFSFLIISRDTVSLSQWSPAHQTHGKGKPYISYFPSFYNGNLFLIRNKSFCNSHSHVYSYNLILMLILHNVLPSMSVGSKLWACYFVQQHLIGCLFALDFLCISVKQHIRDKNVNTLGKKEILAILIICKVFHLWIFLKKKKRCVQNNQLFSYQI